jgi:hypothetical protein
LSLIKKLGWYGSAVSAAAVMALAMLMAAPASNTNAAAIATAFGSASVQIGATNVLDMTNSDAKAAADFAVVTIDPLSTGTAHFKANNGQSVVVFDNAGLGTAASPAVPHSTEAGGVTVALDGKVGIAIIGDSIGVIIIHVQHTDAVDTSNKTLAYTVTAAPGTLTITNSGATPAVAGAASTLTVTLKDTAGVGIAGSVNLTTTTGQFDAVFGSGGAAGTGGCTATQQVCNILLDADGSSTVGLRGNGVSGTATITATHSGVTAVTTTVTLVGTVKTGVVSTGETNATGTPKITSSSQYYLKRNTTAAGNSLAIGVTLKDSAGNATGAATKVSSVKVTGPALAATPITSPNTNPGFGDLTGNGCSAGATGATSKGLCAVHIANPQSATLGAYAIKITWSTGNSTTVTVNIVKGTSAAITHDAPTSLVAGEVSNFTVSVRDSNGSPVQDGSTVTIVATGNILVLKPTSTAASISTAGDIAVQLVAAAGTGTGILAINSGSVTVTHTITVGAAAATPSTAASVSGFTPAAGQQGLVVFSNLATAADGFGLVCGGGAAGASISMTNAAGATLVNVSGAPTFANSGFDAGIVLGGTQAAYVSCP